MVGAGRIELPTPAMSTQCPWGQTVVIKQFTIMVNAVFWCFVPFVFMVAGTCVPPTPVSIGFLSQDHIGCLFDKNCHINICEQIGDI